MSILAGEKTLSILAISEPQLICLLIWWYGVLSSSSGEFFSGTATPKRLWGPPSLEKWVEE